MEYMTLLKNRQRLKGEILKAIEEGHGDDMLNALLDAIGNVTEMKYLPNGDLKMSYDASNRYVTTLVALFTKILFCEYPDPMVMSLGAQEVALLEDKAENAELIFPTPEHALRDAEECFRDALEAGDTLEDARRIAGGISEESVKAICKDMGIKYKAPKEE